jgi:ABC-2 type transport system ATP-binding protein
MEDLEGAAPKIEAHGLTRDFKKTRAVDCIDLSIQTGELFGLVGPDGAGKSTTLRLLAGLLDITAGRATVAGYDLQHQAEVVKRHIGYMAQRFSLYGELSVVENLSFFAELYGVQASELRERTEQLLRFAGLTGFRGRRASRLSGGMQKKLALACTLIHRPAVLLLDEPTTGVDPVSRREFWDILTDLHLAGTTVVVSTPYMDEADRCSRVGLMHEGRMIVCDTPKQIRARVRGELIELRPGDWQAAGALVETLPGVFEVQTYGELLRVLVDSAEARLPEIEAALDASGLTHTRARAAPVRMEEAFISLVTRMESASKHEQVN